MNIFETYKFSEKKGITAFDLLESQSKYLIAATSGELVMDIEVCIVESPQTAVLYILYVKSPKLGNYRRKIITITEYSEIGPFPVEIISHLNNDKIFRNVPETTFLNTVEKIINNPIVKRSIQSLYAESKNISQKT
jgi:hypothetical protein